MSDASPVIWVISDGRRGIENQALGLAEAAAQQTPAIIKRKIIGSDGGFAALPPPLQILRKPKLVKYGLGAPYPDIAIGCGRQAIAPLRLIKKYNPKTYVIYIQDPRGSYAHFDLIIAPEHDALNRANALSMIGSPNRVTAEKLAHAAQDFRDKIDSYAAPRAAFLIGGPSKARVMTSEIRAQHLNAAKDLLDQSHALFITLSRRSDDESRRAWAKLAAQNPDKIWLYDGAVKTDQKAQTPNPYFAFLAAADFICVSEESTNMLTESCAAGKPVYRLPMGGHAGKFQQLYGTLETTCGVTVYEGQTHGKAYAPLNETQRIAALVWKHIASR